MLVRLHTICVNGFFSTTSLMDFSGPHVDHSAFVEGGQGDSVLREVKLSIFSHGDIAEVDNEEASIPLIVIRITHNRLEILEIVVRGSGVYDVDLFGLLAKAVLIHFEDLGTVMEYVGNRVIFLEVADVVQVHAQDQWGLREAPHCPVRSGLLLRQFSPSEHEHVWVIPVTWARLICMQHIVLEVGDNLEPRIRFGNTTESNVDGGSPGVGEVGSPIPNLLITPVTQGVEDSEFLLAGAVDGVTHSRVSGLGGDALVITIIIFEIVDLPEGQLERVILLVAERSWITSAGLGAG